jgi:hypothetical protein
MLLTNGAVFGAWETSRAAVWRDYGELPRVDLRSAA